MPKKVLVALPPAMLDEIDFIAAAEHRTRSDLIREGMRRYIESFRNKKDLVLAFSDQVATAKEQGE